MKAEWKCVTKMPGELSVMIMWDGIDARVVCRQLGFSTQSKYPQQISFSGPPKKLTKLGAIGEKTQTIKATT